MQSVRHDVSAWDVVRGRMTGLQDPEGVGAVGDDHATQFDRHPPRVGLDARWTGILPDRFRHGATVGLAQDNGKPGRPAPSHPSYAASVPMSYPASDEVTYR